MNTSAQAIADILKVSVNHLTPPGDLVVFLDMCKIAGKDMEIEWFIDNTLQAWDVGMLMKSAILSRMQRAAEVRAYAANRGYLLPDDPLPRFEEINSSREPFARLSIQKDEFDALGKATVDLARIAKAFDSGKITFERRQPAWQLSHFEISLDGISQGDPLTDILGYQPDIDFVKRKRALESLAKLDFSKRKPYFLFISDVIDGGRRKKGTIVCWAKMHEASGYNVYKRDVFAMTDYTPMTLSNEWLDSKRDELREIDSFVQAMSFYDWIDVDGVCAFIDPQTDPNTLYSYQIEGVQQRAPSSPFLFQGEFKTLYLNAFQLSEVKRLAGEQAAAVGTDFVSPYPALSQIVYGDEAYGWILAGYNMLASRQRGESTEQVRSLSFIGSRVDHIISEASAGRLVMPSELDSVPKAVEAGISAYGVGQTIMAALDGVGATFFISGKDEIAGFQPTVQSIERAGGGLSRILAAIDTESATLDSRLLLSSIVNPTAPRYSASEVPQTGARDSVVNEQRIDLTTYQGIAKLMMLIRAIYDFHPGALA